MEQQPAQKQTFIAMSFRKTRWRFLALVLTALVLLGNNYSFDNPQALQVQIEADLDITISQFNLLYSVFSLPNIFLTIFGGLIIDKLGVRFGVFTFTLCVTVAQIVFAIGGSYKMYYLMLFGRALFGIASENLIIAQTTFISLWFKGKELATAVGIIMTVPEIGSALNSFLSPLIYEKSGGLSKPLFASVYFCIFSFACACGLILLDQHAEKKDNQQKQLALLESGKEEAVHSHESVSFKDIKKLSGTFWILLLIGTLCLSIYIPFLDNVNEFCQERFNFSSVFAGRAIVATYLTPPIISPIIGMLVDKTGYRRRWCIFTTAVFTFTHLLFAVIPTPSDGEPQLAAMLPLVLLGASYALYSCVVVPSIQTVVEQRIMGTALGLLGVAASIGQVVFPLVAAQIYMTYDNYQEVALFYMGIGGLSVLFAVSLYFIDKKGGKMLDQIQHEDLHVPQEDTSSNPSSTNLEEEEDELELIQKRLSQSQAQKPANRVITIKNDTPEVPVFAINR